MSMIYKMYKPVNDPLVIFLNEKKVVDCYYCYLVFIILLAW